jgi:tetratricopeptide (TPR) repeat protein
MSVRSFICSTLAAALLGTSVIPAEQSDARERAQEPYRIGLEQMRNEAFDQAVKAFEAAVATDGTFDMAYYMLGRAHLSRKQFAAAVYALEKCRDLHQADATRKFEDRREGTRLRRERISELDRLIEETEAAASRPANASRRFSMLEQVRQYQERKRQIQDLDRNDGLRPSHAIPGFVSLSLGSALYRNGNVPEAEKAWLAAVAADPKIGEAHNNLAVVYMETGRLDEAEKALKAAEKAGLKVSPALKEELEKRKKAAGG